MWVSPASHLRLDGMERVPPTDVGDIVYAFDVLYTCETDPYLGRASPSNGVCSHAGSNDLLPAKLKEVLYDNQFEQHWLQAENDRQVVGFGAEMVTDETYGFRGWNWPFTTTSPKGKELAQSKEVSLFWSGMAESMRMQQYIYHTDHNLWDVIVNGDLEEEPAPTGETSAPPAPKTAKQLAAKRNQERVKSILLLAIPDEYPLKFHNVADAKSLWEAIKSRFGGNEASKKMQKNVLKHQFENFSTASNESLDKAYDRFQKLISQLEVHGAPISKEDIN
ncbi:hypothetical protein Tco_1383855 [Tanacetum coccineum]